MARTGTIHRPEVHPLSTRPDFARLLRVLRDRRGLCALDSAAGWPRRYSWIAFDPPVSLSDPDAGFPELAALREEARRLPTTSVPGPFAGGFLGALAFDLGVAGEAQTLPAEPWGMPRLVGGLYTDFFVFDHRADRVWLVLGAHRGRDRRESLLRCVDEALETPLSPPRFGAVGELHRRVAGEEHVARIERARRLIGAGEIYQANLAHSFEQATVGDPLELYLRLRVTNPAPYMAYLRFEGGALLSASPELLLEVDGRVARTRPIKGTIRRDPDPAEDRRLADALQASEKDRAELAMIVDLERNDIGRVARPGSVVVEDFPTLRSYAGVHHLTADIVGELAEGRDAFDALLSLFPGGSVTGAPKLRAMDVIAKLEGEGRGFFTGSVGFLDSRGNALFNILIRTLVWRPEPASGIGAGRVRYHVGGGITWGSDPEAEDQETLVKGAKLAETLNGHARRLPELER